MSGGVFLYVCSSPTLRGDRNKIQNARNCAHALAHKRSTRARDERRRESWFQIY